MKKAELLAIQKALYDKIEVGDRAACQKLVSLKEHFDLNREIEGKTALACAVKSGVLESVRDLLDAGADINQPYADHAKKDWQTTALHASIYKEKNEMALFLMERGADLHARDKYEQMALHRAASWGNLELCQALVAAGADINAAGIVGHTPLHEAAGSMYGEDNVGVCRYLIAAGADIERVADRGDTPLYNAVFFGNLDACRVLVEAGADPHFVAPNAKEDYLTPFQEAVRDGKRDIVRFFVMETDVDFAQKSIGGRTLAQIGASKNMAKFLSALKTELAIHGSMAQVGEETAAVAPRRQTGMAPL